MEKQSLIELLKGKTVIDEFYINYRFNSKIIILFVKKIIIILVNTPLI